MVTGSEKQMKWYEEILKEAYDYLDARYNHKIAVFESASRKK